MLRFALLTIVLVIVFCGAQPSQVRADVLNITGSFGLSQTNPQIDFLPVGAGTGTFMVDPFTQTGIFVPIAGTAGTVTDLNSAAQPAGVPILLPNFLTFAASPTLRLDLTFINLGIYGVVQCGAAPAAGQNCTPSPTSPFNMTNLTATSSTLSFMVAGNVVNGAISTPFTGTFSTQFTNMSFQQVLATISVGGTVTATYSANFVTEVNPVPEPATMLLLGSGLVGIAAKVRKRRKSV